jgi:transcriptional regulator GlxA family with amidase domain
MLDWHDYGQLPFASLPVAKQVNDAVIVRCQEWVAVNYGTAAPAAAMMDIAGLPERSFVRRFSKATGMSPLEYVHRLRIEEAKQLLEISDAPVEAVAVEVGYQDTSFFGSLFRRRVELTPAQYRRRFSSLRKALEH